MSNGHFTGWIDLTKGSISTDQLVKAFLKVKGAVTKKPVEKDEVIEIEFMEFLVPKKSNKTERLYYIATRYGYYEGNGVYYIGFYSSFRVLGVVDLTEEGKTIFTIKDYFVTLKITVNVITPYSGEIWFDGAIGKTQYLEGAFESEEEYQNAIADAKQYYYEKLENYSRLYSVALSTDSQVAADAWTTEFASMTQETGKWMSSVNDYLTGTEKAFADFNSALSTIKNDVVGTNLEDMAENTKAIVDYSNQLAQEVTKEGGVIDALTNEISAVEDITEAYATFRDTLKEIETQYEQIAADADAAVKAAAGLPGVTTGQPGDGNTNVMGCGLVSWNCFSCGIG